MRKLCLNIFTLLLIVSCNGGDGDSNRSSDSRVPDQTSRPNDQDQREPDRPQDDVPTRIVLDPADMESLPKLKPTTYYVAKEEDTDCRGKYRGVVYNGAELTTLRDVNGKELARVCTKFYKVLLMEGTAVLNDRGLGRFTLNYAKKVNGTHRFVEMDKCVFGEGVKKNLCLIPFHTLAADMTAYNVGDVVYIPDAVDIVLPDGSLHDGFFLVRDTGGAFKGKGLERIDMFTGFQTDKENVFLRAGFHRGNPKKAYRITGKSKQKISARFKSEFPEIF